MLVGDFSIGVSFTRRIMLQKGMVWIGTHSFGVKGMSQ